MKSFWVRAVFLLNTIHGEQRSRDPFCVCCAAISENQEQLRESDDSKTSCWFFFFGYPWILWKFFDVFFLFCFHFSTICHPPWQLFTSLFLFHRLTKVAELAYITKPLNTFFLYLNVLLPSNPATWLLDVGGLAWWSGPFCKLDSCRNFNDFRLDLMSQKTCVSRLGTWVKWLAWHLPALISHSSLQFSNPLFNPEPLEAY